MSLNLLVRPQESLPWSQGHGWWAHRSAVFPGTSPRHVECQVWRRRDSGWMQPSCWGNRSNDDSSGWWLSSPGESPQSLSCFHKYGFPTFRSHLRMRPLSRRHSRRGLLGGSTFRPPAPGPALGSFWEVPKAPLLLG